MGVQGVWYIVLVLAMPTTSAAILLPDYVSGRPVVRMTDDRGRAVARRDVELRPLFRQAAGLYRIGSGLLVRIKPESALTPLIENAATDALRRRWSGRRVWPYGGRIFDGSEGTRGTSLMLEVPATQPLRIDALYRLRRPKGSPPLAVSNTMLEGEGVTTATPLLIVVSPPSGTSPISWGTVGEASTGGGGGHSDELRSGRNVRWSRAFTDEAGLFRAFSARAPQGKALLAAEGRVPQKGMTPDEVAWAIGWPPAEGSLVQLRQRRLWDYPRPAPFGSSVVFRNGRVLRYNPPGRLP